MDAIVTKDLCKRFQTLTAVDRLNLTVREGELFALLGVNGAGKTTTIRMLTCLSAPTSGDAFLLGDSVLTNERAVKEKTNLSPQETAIAPNLTVKENLFFMARIYGCAAKEAETRCEALLRSLSLDSVCDRRAKTLSGGYQRRLSIAMALISDPKILFLDEPTLGLDVIARRELWTVIEALKGKTTIILTTHYLEEAQALSDRIGIMAGGKLKAVGTAEELIARTGKPTFEEAFIEIASGEEHVK